jgi:GT2 family glycosyltransferase
VPTLTVVVPATDSPDCLGRCRAALEAADDGPEEIIVVDSPRSLTASAARNRGAEQARGDVVVFVDADVVVHRDAFSRLRDAFARRPDLVAVFGSYDDMPDAPGRVATFRNLLHHHVHHRGAGPAETFWTGLGAVRRSDFLAVGGFDEARFPHPSVEDVDLGDRLWQAGGSLLLDPSIQGTHLKAWTLRSMVLTDFARRGVPWVAMQVRNRRVSRALNLGWRHRASAAASVAVVSGALARNPAVTAAALGGFVALNAPFYAVLARRQGPGGAVAGVALHLVHHLVAVASVPAGVAVAVGEEVRGRWRRVPTPAPTIAAAGGRA